MEHFAFTGLFMIPDSAGTTVQKHYNDITWDEHNKQLLISIVDIDDGVSSIPDDFFYGRVNLKEVNFPKSIRRIGKRAFADCPLLHRVNLPLGLTELGDSAFDGCSSLSEVLTDGSYGEFPENVKYIGNAAFRNTAIEYLDFGSSNWIIGDHAFSGCTALTSVGLYHDVCAIGEYAFAGCTSLTDVEIFDSVMYLSPTAFHNCNSLAPENIPSARVPTDFPDPGPLAFSVIDGCTHYELSDTIRCAISMAPFLDFRDELKLCLKYPHYYFHLSMDYFRIEAWNGICKVYAWEYIVDKEFDYIRTQDLYHVLFGTTDRE